MNKPYIIYHMLTSLDGKIAGKFLEEPQVLPLHEHYYSNHRNFKADAFLCGRVTMQGSFTGEALPDIAAWQGKEYPRTDCVAEKADFYAVAVDTKGKLNWQTNRIADDDPGYDNAHIIEILCENVNDAYIGFLQSKNISYIFAGKEQLDLPLAMQKLCELFGIEKLLLEGGGIIGGAFAKENLIDEISFVCAPVIQGNSGQPAFADCVTVLPQFSTFKTEPLENGGMLIKYLK